LLQDVAAMPITASKIKFINSLRFIGTSLYKLMVKMTLLHQMLM
jgi:hypothetical protein